MTPRPGMTARQPTPIGPPQGNAGFDPRSLFPGAAPGPGAGAMPHPMIGRVDAGGMNPMAPAAGAEPGPASGPPRNMMGSTAPPMRYPSAYSMGGAQTDQANTLNDLAPALQALRARLAGGGGGAGLGF